MQLCWGEFFIYTTGNAHPIAARRLRPRDLPKTFQVLCLQ